MAIEIVLSNSYTQVNYYLLRECNKVQIYLFDLQTHTGSRHKLLLTTTKLLFGINQTWDQPQLVLRPRFDCKICENM